MTDKIKLGNGLTILYHHTPQDPVTACDLFLPSGALTEASNQAGLTSLHWSLYLKGTNKRTARQIAEDEEMLGASLGAGATYDYSEISCHVPSDQIHKSLEILTECLFEPVFDEKEITKEKTALSAAIRSKKESIFTMTQEKLNQHLYPNHPYGRAVSGTEESVQKLTREHLLARHGELVHPEGGILTMASNIPWREMESFLKDLFGESRWPAPSKKISPTIKTSLPKTSVEFKSPSHFDQAYLMMGFPAPTLGSDDYVPLKVLNGIMGGGMSTRLFQTLREKEGLAYDVGSFYPSKKLGSAFIIHMGLQAPRIEEAKQGIRRELEKIKNQTVPDTELTQVKNQMKGTFILDHQTNSQRAHYLGWWEILGLGADFDRTYPTQIEAVTADDIQRVAQKCFNNPSVTVETVPKSKSPVPEPVQNAK